MKDRIKNTALALGMLVCLSGTAHAQLKDNIEVNAFGAGSWWSVKNFETGFPQSTTPIQGKFRFDTDWRAGFRVGVYERGHWGEEFYFSYEPNHAHFIRTTPPTNSLDLSTKVLNYGINALYFLNDDESHKVRTFLSVGVGGTAYILSNDALAVVADPLRGNLPDLDNSNEVALNYGFGVKTRSSRWVGFRADVRGFVGRAPSFGLARRSNDPTAVVFPASSAINNLEASAGIVVYFFGRR